MFRSNFSDKTSKLKSFEHVESFNISLFSRFLNFSLSRALGNKINQSPIFTPVINFVKMRPPSCMFTSIKHYKIVNVEQLLVSIELFNFSSKRSKNRRNRQENDRCNELINTLILFKTPLYKNQMILRAKRKISSSATVKRFVAMIYKNSPTRKINRN